ncbi:MAG: hypothetical protein NTV34_03840 [Proteobacteria bacterium]|nr:hypothetical protein [Pseudomonadota bacterium]
MVKNPNIVESKHEKIAPSKLQEQGIHVDALDLDLSLSSWDESLSKVWVEESTGELCASMDRLLFESPTSAALRFMEPQGFQLNLENILACLDSMRFSIITKTSPHKKEGKFSPKKIIPSLYMKLPQRSARGHLLSKFYEEVGKYESELSRLQQFEAQSRRLIQEALKDETGKMAVARLQNDNEILRQEIGRLSKQVGQLTSAINAAPILNRENAIPSGVRSCQVRQVKEQENLIHLKADEGQYSFPLSKINGTPTVAGRALAYFEGGIARAVWVFDPLPEPFKYITALVLFADSASIKVRSDDRVERVIAARSADQGIRRGHKIILVFSGATFIDWINFEVDKSDWIAEELYDNQTARQLSAQGHDTENIIVPASKQTAGKRKRRAA